MKPSRFDYQQARDTSEISAALLADHSVKIVAGGQSLGPMLNLRLVQPTMLLDITRLTELKSMEQGRDHITLGACVTHANIEDGCVPGPAGKILSIIARGIAYRAVRNRGTIGGSLAHADPSADWITTLMALDAELRIRKGSESRWMHLAGAMSGPFDIGLQAGEWIEAVRIPLVSEQSLWGFCKINRKTGEFAHAMSAVMHDARRERLRMVIGATESAPIVMDQPLPINAKMDLQAIKREALDRLEAAGVTDALDNRVRMVALERALQKSSPSGSL